MSYKSPYPDVEIPNSTLFEHVFGSIDEADLDRPAIVDGESGETVTYRTLIAQIEGIAGALAARGVQPGDVVGVYFHNSPAFPAVLHGILRAGATATPINVLYTADDVAKQLARSGARYLFTSSKQYVDARDAAARNGIAADHLFVIDGVPEHPSLKDMLDQGESAPDVTFDPAVHVAVLPFSSGTTAEPKGVLLTHRNLVANVAQTVPGYGITKSDVLLGLLPFFHIYGLTVLLNVAMRTRSRVITMPRFDLENFLRICEKHGLTYLFIAPPVAVTLAKHPLVDEYDLSTVRAVMSGAAPLDEVLGKRVADRIGARVLQGYGMSELSPVSHMIPIERNDIAISSVGLPLPNTENKLVDIHSGQEIPLPDQGVSTPGELLVKGPNVMAGYLNNSAATAETVDSEGFLHTGDIAVYGADGAVYIVDRLKELIKYKGYQVPPAELEAVLLSHPEIADAAVVGVVDDGGEEVPKAFVVRQPGSPLDEEGVMNFVAEQVSPHKKVRMVQFIDVVPKSAAGKILRRELRSSID